ncbi:hypothetical protein [Microbulbifer sp. YPW1]|uniref:hypothetical protein n=1 Tax=Microbulbifer sp. YPW1 TaxID=2745199 RepID=UPI001597C7C4|nr:hypothetical protein [Microbulbifer sp. YPW1]QKX18088.1 hypothetical protein HUW35_14580 [Microbulbifer sp. YPW1]
MKVVFYGASVTAQRFNSGYYQVLQERLAKSSLVVTIDRVAYGASHLDWAGFAMIDKVLELKPDICFLDWVTPSSSEFCPEKIHFISKLLLDRGCLPVWVLLPRMDDYSCRRTCCDQLRNYALEHNIPCHELLKETGIVQAELADLLRDVVHTTEQGAVKYSEYFFKLIQYYSEIRIADLYSLARDTYKSHDEVGAPPAIYSVDGEVSIKSSLEIKVITDLETRSGGAVEVFLFARIGPRIPCLSFKVHTDAGGLVHKQSLNFADPWCYYERNMLLSLPVIQPGLRTEVTFLLEAEKVDPFESVDLRQPLKDPSSSFNDRVLPFFEVVVHGGSVKDIKLQDVCNR